jgi:hypothetical protein
MKMPFKRDTAAEIRKTTEAASQAAAKLVTLRAERATLLTGDDLNAIGRADDRVVAQERHIAVLQDRLRALEQLQRQERQGSLEQQKAATLVQLERSLRAEADAAVAVVEAFVTAANALNAYKAQRGRRRPWSELLVNQPGIPIGIADLVANICHTFYWPKLAEHQITEIPPRAPALIEQLRASTDRSISWLRDAPLPKAVLIQPEPIEEEVA